MLMNCGDIIAFDPEQIRRHAGGEVLQFQTGRIGNRLIGIKTIGIGGQRDRTQAGWALGPRIKSIPRGRLALTLNDGWLVDDHQVDVRSAIADFDVRGGILCRGHKRAKHADTICARAANGDLVIQVDGAGITRRGADRLRIFAGHHDDRIARIVAADGRCLPASAAW